VSYQNESYETKCTIDQGGLVVIAAAIFWSVAFLISVVYIKDPKRDMGIRDGRITNAFDQRTEERQVREKERRIKTQTNRERKHQRRVQKRQAHEQPDLSRLEDEAVGEEV